MSQEHDNINSKNKYIKNDIIETINKTNELVNDNLIKINQNNFSLDLILKKIRAEENKNYGKQIEIEVDKLKKILLYIGFVLIAIIIILLAILFFK